MPVLRSARLEVADIIILNEGSESMGLPAGNADGVSAPKHLIVYETVYAFISYSTSSSSESASLVAEVSTK